MIPIRNSDPMRNWLILLAVFLAFLGGCKFSTPISPGELAIPHAALDGTSNCTQCHTLGKKVSNNKCLDCHSEIKERIDQKKGYHNSAEVKGKKCYTCHSDHHGKEFEIIHFETEKFDHVLTGYELIGAHSKKKCNECHKSDFITGQKIKEKKKTYLGLQTDCLTCHEDYHQNTLASNCSDCHTQETFKPASKFGHTKTKFPLIGQHLQLDCVKCHAMKTRQGDTFQEFAGIPFDNCNSCHTDVHDNKFGKDCQNCHSEESFHQIRNANEFDHRQTQFALSGKHTYVSCKKCHKTALTDPLKHQYCYDCHTDYHKKQFVKNGIPPDCNECHTVNGFSESNYTVEKHAFSVFPLEGAHLKTSCSACHKKGTNWSFKYIGNKCKDCHDNIHKNLISEKYYPDENCKKCHSNNDWKEIEFNHAITNFTLSGVHKSQSCRSCHFNLKITGGLAQKFSGLSSSCAACHTDIHFRQFERNGIVDCSECHDFNDWHASKFNHNDAAFKLDGKHQNVACAKCHKEVKEGQNIFTLYKIKDYRCEACH
ncbi:MAG: cytochrome C [Bacteroidetes bacterium]|nr:cytochrome C [Bacteroidota bacterium]